MSEMSEHDVVGEIPTLVEVLRWRALHEPSRRALIFLQDGEKEEAHFTYRELDARARSIAAQLQSLGMAGERALLLFPSGLEFIAAFMGCLYAGAVAVPANPPRGNRNLHRLRGIMDDAQAKLALTTAAMLARLDPLLGEAGLDVIPWMATGDMQAPAGSWQDPVVGRDTVALLQYTSGSISRPKGVMVSHGNLLSNARMIRQAFGQSRQTTIVSWLPLFHDMGLIGNVLQGIYLGAECVLMPPEMFLMKPVRWLQAISRYGARNSGGPNFAYELCAQRVTAEQRASLDLSAWELAFIGAEPVRAGTLERFAEAFAPCGFRAEAFYPCYGLAEATLFVSGGCKGTGFTSRQFSTRAMERHKVVEVNSGEARTLVSCGRNWQELQVAIVDPDTTTRCAMDRVGEIWISAPSVAQGYWNLPEETERTFRARLPNGNEETYLRTGDLGFFHEDRLFIAGRLKDLIIVAGRNHHPADIEQTAAASHPAVQTDGCAAFSVEEGGEERLVIVAECSRTQRSADHSAVVQAIRQAVAEQHDLGVLAVVFLKPSGIPRTSSGKIRRQACRELFLAGTLDAWKGQP